jgi:plasmid stabilization system protein ParE
VTRLRFDPAARAEYIAAVERYKAESVEPGREFAEDFRSAIDGVLAFPKSYAADSEGIRKRLLRRFPYTLIYTRRDPRGPAEVRRA